MKRVLSRLVLVFLLLLPVNVSATIRWENNATSLVAGGGITAGATSVTVTTGQGDRFPAVTAPHYFMMTLIDVSGNREIVKVTARTAGSNTMTIERAQEGTAAQAFAAGSYVDQRITKHSLDNFSNTYEQFLNYYVCDASATDQADTVNSNSLASLAATIGTSQNATIVLPHTGTGNTTAYNVLQNLDLSTYTNITFVIQRGAIITHGANTVDMPLPHQLGTHETFSGTGTITFNPSDDVVSASPLVLGAGDYFDVTGTNTIDEITHLQGRKRFWLHFDAALQLTHHATDFVLPDGENITTIAGDEAEFVEYAAGKWRCTNYQRTGKLSNDSLSDEFRNLIVTTASVSTVDVDADEIILHTTARGSYRATSVNLTIDITASGANGLDTGAEATGEYQVWVIYNRSTDTVAGLLSLSTSAPTMPSGYTYKAWISSVKNRPGTDFIQFYQLGKNVLLDVAQKVGNDVGAGASTAAVVLTGDSLPTFISEVNGKVMANTGALTFYWHYIVFPNTLSPDNTSAAYSVYLAAATATARWSLPILHASTKELRYQASANTVDIWISGYTLR
jgi:hypothetical protein